jgi:structure-specific endonuclease subunit SLX1
MHIPSEQRLAVATQRKGNGRPRRPAKSLASVASNLHLLLRVLCALAATRALF